MGDSTGVREVRVRLSGVVSRSVTLLTAMSAPLALACAGGSLRMPVYLPGERVECLFEVVGDVTVEGPFRVLDDVDGGYREGVLEGVRLKVSQQALASGADAVMVRELRYDRDPAAIADDAPEIIAAEGMLLSFVDPACVPNE